MSNGQFEISTEVSKLLLELSVKSKELGEAIQSDGAMLDEIVNVDLTDDLSKKMKDSE